jgi:hypothetical protein
MNFHPKIVFMRAGHYLLKSHIFCPKKQITIRGDLDSNFKSQVWETFNAVSALAGKFVDLVNGGE